jgi:stage III sporulation protein AB
MLTKWIAAAAIVGISSLIGMEMAKGYVLRTRELQEIIGVLTRLDTEIHHYATRLPEALQRSGCITSGPVGRLFDRTSELLVGQMLSGVREAWRTALSEAGAALHLDQEDLEILARLGDQLGSSDREGQRRYIHLTLQQLAVQEEKAQALRQKYERMYKSLGVLGGLALAILLL